MKIEGVMKVSNIQLVSDVAIGTKTGLGAVVTLAPFDHSGSVGRSGVSVVLVESEAARIRVGQRVNVVVEFVDDRGPTAV